MIIVLRPHATEADIDYVNEQIRELGYEPRMIRGTEQTIIGAVGDELSHRSLETLRNLAPVENVLPIQKRYKVASREFHPEDTCVEVGGCPIGRGHFQLIAGPCGVESRPQLDQAAKDLSGCGIRILRGGAYKPRTSPYDFQGLGQEGLDILAEAKATYGMAIVTEIVAVTHVQQVAEVADMLQIGARNCQNYHLLTEVAQAGKPVLLKRGMAATVEEWISAAEYLMVNGCKDVVLCERGIRTYETATRNTLDVGAVAVAKQETHLPVIVDPSHPAGKRSLVLPLALAGVAAGADGLIVEAHPDPSSALSDASQQLPSGDFHSFMEQVRALVQFTGKSFCTTGS